MPSFKLVTVRAVKHVADRLMRSHGDTTPAEVRAELCRRGYWALEDDVAVLMQHLAASEAWIVRSEGAVQVFAPAVPEESADAVLLHLLVSCAEGEARRFWGEQFAERHRN